jgi:murein DD-endopeptidase MepM/ murein hydrolase activator NlpD
MANLRIDDQRRVAPGQAPGQFDAPDASRGAEFASRQMQQTGQALSQAGQAVGAIYRAEVEKLNETRVNDALNRVAVTAQEQQAEWSGLRGEAAIAVGENREPLDQVYGARFEKSVGDIAREMGLTGEQLEMFAPRASTYTTQYRGSMIQHASRERESYEAEVAVTRQAIGQQAILGNPGDETVTGPARRDIRDAVISDRRRKGLSTEGDELAVLDVTGKAYLDAIIATEDEDFEGAQQLFNRYRDFMTPAQQNAAQNTLSVGIAYNEAEAYVAAARQGVAPPPGQPGSEFQHPAPGADVSSSMGMRIHPITGARTMHGGTDFAAPLGSPARGMMGGRVLEVSYDELNGNIVRIDHGNGLVGSYAHLQGADVREGQEITAGQNIGRVGSTGRSTGPHLHVTMRRNGELVDPETLIGESAQAAEGQAAAGRPTRAQMEADARQRFSNNRVQREAALSAISRVYGEEDRAKREAEQAALDAAYAHIEQTNTMPTPAMLAALPPGRLNGVQGYLDARLARLADPVMRSDPAVRLRLAAMNPEQLARLARKSPQEIEAEFGPYLSTPDLESLIGQSTRASEAQKQAARAATVVPHAEYTRAFASVTDIMGIDRTPSGPGALEDRQQLEVLDQGVREWVVSRQVAAGRQLDENEIRQEIQSRLARLAAGNRRTSTGYDSMRQADREAARQRLIILGMPRGDIDETAIYREHVRVRVTQGN